MHDGTPWLHQYKSCSHTCKLHHSTRPRLASTRTDPVGGKPLFKCLSSIVTPGTKAAAPAPVMLGARNPGNVFTRTCSSNGRTRDFFDRHFGAVPAKRTREPCAKLRESSECYLPNLRCGLHGTSCQTELRCMMLYLYDTLTPFDTKTNEP